ncbi:glycine cleavage system protein H [Paenibacillus roseipurpureus]|uniref:Glycine cleavage system protein H n=1 Tax=Paenibacillus roseopurpureus TaxID=2918901 RepID=A0AA96LMF7_9BACL|nr:glycine cleavage system protein H [Paenibacillus sp. MBLB1832]WNR43703.1 glycine cleavage system protein H [Paenibacillus sp. MBLB1832]
MDVITTEDVFWIRREGNEAVIGLSEHGLEKWGMILYIELPEKGAELTNGGFLGSLETATHEYELLSPVSGKVIGVNMLLERATMLLYESPYEKGWLFRVALN